jgi:hypothetical protein
LPVPHGDRLHPQLNLRVGEEVEKLPPLLFKNRIDFRVSPVFYCPQMNYFRYDNASRAVKLGDKRFVFDVVGQLAGGWVGVLATEDARSIELLSNEGKALGIQPLTEAEYQEQLKKKVVSNNSTQGSTSNKIVLPRPGRLSAAVVVNRDGAPVSQTKGTSNPVPTVKTLASVEEAVLIGKASFVEPLEAKVEAAKGSKRKSKK